jgi:bifunctional non-homologous end joining protein LigD
MAARQNYGLDIDGQTVSVTNPDKPMFPSGFTKGQVIDYYVRISDYLLPHIRQHPITLKRYPNGTAAPHFYEKNAPQFTPKWIETFAVPRRAGGQPIRFVLLNNPASLVWSANLANLELHPFLARAPEIERPLSVVFDLDPGEGADVLSCVEIAFLLRDNLAQQGLESFAKVSGSKGMQVYAPLNTKITYAQTQPFARGVAEQMERAHPDLVVSEMAKGARSRKVFIDWSQNSDFKTTVAPYSLRAKRDRPYVSLPFTWEELRRAARKQDPGMLYVDPDAAVRRVEKIGDLLRPVLELKQRLPATKRTRKAGSA